MIIGNCNIEFESRREIELFMCALGEYVEKHPEKKNDVEGVIDQLDYMHMVW